MENCAHTLLLAEAFTTPWLLANRLDKATIDTLSDRLVVGGLSGSTAWNAHVRGRVPMADMIGAELSRSCHSNGVFTVRLIVHEAFASVLMRIFKSQPDDERRITARYATSSVSMVIGNVIRKYPVSELLFSVWTTSPLAVLQGLLGVSSTMAISTNVTVDVGGTDVTGSTCRALVEPSRRGAAILIEWNGHTSEIAFTAFSDEYVMTDVPLFRLQYNNGFMVAEGDSLDKKPPFLYKGNVFRVVAVVHRTILSRTILFLVRILSLISQDLSIG